MARTSKGASAKRGLGAVNSQASSVPKSAASNCLRERWLMEVFVRVKKSAVEIRASRRRSCCDQNRAGNHSVIQLILLYRL